MPFAIGIPLTAVGVSHVRGCKAVARASYPVVTTFQCKAIRLVGSPRKAANVFTVFAEVAEAYDPEFDAEDRMDKSIVSCEKELGGIRTGL